MDALVFEHELIVNPDDAPIPLSPAQLWRGLLLRAREPMRFVPALSACHILLETGFGLERELHFGAQRIYDKVVYDPPDAVHYIVTRGAGQAGSALSMSITTTEYGPGLKFRYQRPSASTDQLDVDEYLKEAYRQADQALLKTLRKLAAAGLLDPEDPNHGPLDS